MSNHILESAHLFLLNNARLLERLRFAALFQGGAPQAALAALKAYQNADGGFGNALEPDKRTPSSQPIDQEFALRVLDEIGFDAASAGQICDFLQTITTPAGGVPFVLPTVSDAPRTPWWNTEPDPPASINPTASIAGLLHKHGFQHPWLGRASAFCWEIIESGAAFEGNDALCVALFLEHAPDRPRALRAFDRFSAQLLSGGGIALDPQASGYVHKVLEWAPTPASLFRPLFDGATIQAHLEALAAEQQPDGGWPIAWTTVSTGAEMEYRGVVTMNAVKTMRAYSTEALN